MPSICLTFEVHQPRRLRRYSFFDVGAVHDYEDGPENRRLVDRIAGRCYLPANALLLELIEKHGGDFRCAFSVSGTALDQFAEYRPDVLESFQRLSRTGCVEFLNETFGHSLAFLFSPGEFAEQVLLHRRRVRDLFGQEGRTFRHTELITNDALARAVEEMGYGVMLVEGAERLLGPRSPDRAYRPAGCERLICLPRNYRLSDDVAFRFADRTRDGGPLTAAGYARSLHGIADPEAVIGLCMDYETLGEHQRPETGIFDFLRALPGEVLRHPDFRFRTPAEAAAAHGPAGVIASPGFVSWADAERDTSAWLGNGMQQDAARSLYALETAVRGRRDPGLLEAWRMLQTSDHFYYMCTKRSADGAVHRYFNPYESPYDAYINFMNILDDLSQRVERKKE